MSKPMIHRIKTPQQLSVALQDARLDKKLTQQALAKKIGGVAQKTISLIEKDSENVALGRLLKLLAALDLELEIRPKQAADPDKHSGDQW